jgi:DNA-binding transcriptional LysR family regulator
VRLLLREAFTDQLEAWLHDGELDLAVTTAPTRGALPDHADAWIDDELIVVGGPGPTAERDVWVTFATGSPVRTMLLRHVPADRIVMELGSIAAIKGNVRAGIGLALVSRASVRADLGTGALVEVPQSWTPLSRRLILRHRGVDRLPPAAAALRELLLATAPRLAPLPRPAPRGRGRRRART